MNVRIWLHTAITTFTIFLLVPTARPLFNFFKALLYDAPIIGWFIIILSFLSFFLGLRFLVKSKRLNLCSSPPYFRLAALSRVLFLVSLGGALAVSYLPIEYAHIPVYGLLGVFAADAIDRSTSHFRLIKTLVVCILVSLCDEMLQGLHPERFFDVRDLVLNGLSSLTGILLRDIRLTSLLGTREAKFL